MYAEKLQSASRLGVAVSGFFIIEKLALLGAEQVLLPKLTNIEF